ncbi:MAG: acylase [Candidatus Hydrogenedentes bacterium]|nr:acylase [Candidatus Hydrogenedentota bacterium]
MLKKIGLIVLVLVLLIAGWAAYKAFVPPASYQGADLIPPAGKYNVKILRDTWGVPHIYGKTDADTAYGLAWAHCEDDFATIQESVFLGRGKLASMQGAEAAPMDFLVGLLNSQAIVAEKYETDLSPETRAMCEAYAAGYNHYAALHPDQVYGGMLPVTGQDIVVGFVFKGPFFFGLDGALKNLFSMKEAPALSEKKTASLFGEFRNWYTDGLPIGSNTFSIAPGRTPDGKTHIAINSHQPWTGPVAWYEARMKSEEGYDIVGGVFPGTPVILHGHNRDLGWAHTVNAPDLFDIYKLEMNPDDPMQYKFDGEWKTLEKKTIPIEVRLWKYFTWTVRRNAFYSIHGPVLQLEHGMYAVRVAGAGDIRQVEQWYRMGKSRNIDEFEQAMRIRAIPSLNVGYADKAGNIMYLYNAMMPVRTEGYNYKGFLPGNTSETLWTEYYPFEKCPQVRNPASGFVVNANSTPFMATEGPENPKEADYSPTSGIEKPANIKNRQLRLLEILSADTSITEEEFIAYKYDTKFSRNGKVAEVVQDILAAPAPEDPLLKEAVEVIRKWDFDTNPENTSAALAVMSMWDTAGPRMDGGGGKPVMEVLLEQAKKLQGAFGKLDPAWQDVNRLVRGTINLGLGGGPDILHACYGEWNGKHLEGRAGDCYVLLATWNPDGNVHSQSIHQFGSATLDATSPHYADQAPLFVQRKMKPVWLDEAELRQNLEAEYAPGEDRPGV